MQCISLFIDIAKVADFRWKNDDISRIRRVCHVIYMFSLSSLSEVNCAKFDYYRVCMTDFREKVLPEKVVLVLVINIRY